jgi:hypothetical protein
MITDVFLPRGSLVSDIPGWRRETRELFYGVKRTWLKKHIDKKKTDGTMDSTGVQE